MIRDNDALKENIVKLLYQIVNDLLYFDDDEKGLRLCISTALEAQVFKLAHDEMGHRGDAFFPLCGTCCGRDSPNFGWQERRIQTINSRKVQSRHR